MVCRHQLRDFHRFSAAKQQSRSCSTSGACWPLRFYCLSGVAAMIVAADSSLLDCYGAGDVSCGCVAARGSSLAAR